MHFVWLADAALCPMLPVGWHVFTYDQDGRSETARTPYYYHPVSGAVVWEHPALSFLRGVAAAVVAHLQMHKPETAAPAADESEPSERPPPLVAVPSEPFVAPPPLYQPGFSLSGRSSSWQSCGSPGGVPGIELDSSRSRESSPSIDRLPPRGGRGAFL